MIPSVLYLIHTGSPERTQQLCRDLPEEVWHMDLFPRVAKTDKSLLVIMSFASYVPVDGAVDPKSVDPVDTRYIQEELSLLASLEMLQDLEVLYGSSHDGENPNPALPVTEEMIQELARLHELVKRPNEQPVILTEKQ